MKKVDIRQFAQREFSQIQSPVLPWCFPAGAYMGPNLDKLLISLARPKGFEPLTSAFGGQSPVFESICSRLPTSK